MTDIHGFMLVLAISTAAVILTHVMFYEILRQTWKHLSERKLHPHFGIFFSLMAIFAGHTAAVWFYAVIYAWLSGSDLIGTIVNSNISNDNTFLGGFETMLYFSASTYSSLGFGDVLPTGHLRILAGIEALNGLTLIGWSVTFTYFIMQHFWDRYYKDKKNG